MRFRLARPEDDASLRQLLRETPMGDGDVRLSLEREPSYFAAARLEGPEHRTIVATENGRIICAGSVSTRLRYVNGVATRIGYLGGLRLHPTCRNRISVIRRGYDLFHEAHEHDGGPPVYLTSIVADNTPARRLLERGLPGMPMYAPLGEFVTLVIRRGRPPHFSNSKTCARRRARRLGLRVEYGSDDAIPDVAALLNQLGACQQFAPAWSPDDVRPRAEDFRVLRNADGLPVACAAMWDQRAIKQTVVHGYSPRLRRLRPLLNLAAAVLNRPRLPAVGGRVEHAFVSHIACDRAQPEQLICLIDLLYGSARTRRADYVTLGFDTRDPRLAHARTAFPARREYLSRLYAVYWDPAGDDVIRQLDGRLLAPEVAVL